LRAPVSIIAIATGLLIGSVLIISGSIWLLFVRPDFLFLLPVFVIQIAFSLLGIITAIGLLHLHEPARKAAIFLSTVPLIVLFFALLFLLAAARSTHNLVFAAAFLIYGALFVILIPISIWWLVLLRRESVRSQFR
jgi:hypothetical protein